MTTRASTHPSVMTFIRRSTRMNPSQAQALAKWGNRYLISGLPRTELDTQLAAQPPLDLAAHFGRSAPVAVEIGSGSGEQLSAAAQSHPDWNLVGFEVYEKALAATLSKLARWDVDNVRLVPGDGISGLRHLFAPRSVREVWTYFPDPWQKKRHHKRRLVNREFAQLVADRLIPGGVWRLATDWDDYAAAMRTVLDDCPGLRNRYPNSIAPHDEIRPHTKFEARALAAGRTITDLVYEAL